MLATVLLSSSTVAGGTFPVSQEQVLVGTTDGTAGVQAADGLRETMREADTAPDPIGYAGTQTLSNGSQVSGLFPWGVQSSDGVYIHYRETTTNPISVQSTPAAVDPGCSWSACASGIVSDDSYASSPAGGDFVEYQNFSLTIPQGAVITRVEIGYEAFDATGNDRLTTTISWDGGVSWCPARTSAGLPGVDPNAYTYVDFTACTGHSWTPSDFAGTIWTSFTHSVVGGSPDTIDLDANVVQATYQPLAYELALQYDWTGIALGQRYDLLVKGRISAENVSIQVLTASSVWTTRLVLTGTTDQVQTYTLSAAEFGSGNVSVRFVDALGPDLAASDLWIDGAVILSVVHAYHLDVEQTMGGISGPKPILVIEGNISTGGENFDVFVWNFTAGAWGLKLGSVFTPTNEVHTASLLPDEIASGTVRINYRDRDPASVVEATLTLDLVQVSTTDAAPASALTGILLVGGAIGGIAAIILFVFLVLARRKAASEEPPPPGEARASPLARVLDRGESASPTPKIAIGDLRPGHPYLVEEEEPAKGLRVLERLTRMGRSGLLITRRDPLAVQRTFKLRHTKTVWIGDSSGSGSAQLLAVPLEAISRTVDEFLRTNPIGAVLIDGLRDLVASNEFPAVQEFIKRTVEKVSSGQQILLVSMSPGVLQSRELKLLAQQLDIVRIG